MTEIHNPSESEKIAAQAITDMLESEAFCGLAGKVVKTIAPQSEAAPMALLLSFLVAFGTSVGRGPHMVVDAARHPAKLFVVLVGKTSKGRKGTSWNQIQRLMSQADSSFTRDKIMGGFASGEGLLDAMTSKNDGRLLVVDSEWARLLVVGSRQGSTLTFLMRDAWDNEKIATRSRGTTVVVEHTHMGLLGHVTAEELHSKLTGVDIANGFANRHLFCLVERSQLLPHGGRLSRQVIEELGNEVGEAIAAGKEIGEMKRSPEAEVVWERLYKLMAEDEPVGIVGAIISRDAAQVLRLSMIYALLDGTSTVDVDHVWSAWSVWQECRLTASALFGKKTSDPVADRTLEAVRRAGPSGVSLSQQSRLFNGHKDADALKTARDLLVEKGLVELVIRNETGGRHSEFLIAISGE